METVTQWFGGDEKPVHVGVYQRKYLDSSVWYCMWNGEYFLDARWTAEMACRIEGKSIFPDLPWRGLAERPAK